MVPGSSLEVPEAPWWVVGSPWKLSGGAAASSLEIPKGSHRVLIAPWSLWKVPGRSLDHQMHCFPRNLKGSVPGVPDANLVQLFKSWLGQTFQHQSLESPWTSLEDPWRVPGSSLEVPGGPWWVPGGSLEGPWGSPGRSLEIPKGSHRVLRAPWWSLEGPFIVPGSLNTLFSKESEGFGSRGP